jgi:hypothetical protein
MSRKPDVRSRPLAGGSPTPLSPIDTSTLSSSTFEADLDAPGAAVGKAVLEAVGQDLHRDQRHRHGLGHVHVQRLHVAGDLDAAFRRHDAGVGADGLEELAEVDERTVVVGVVEQVVHLGERQQALLDVAKPRRIAQFGRLGADHRQHHLEIVLGAMVRLAQKPAAAFGRFLRLLQQAPVEGHLALAVLRSHPADRLGRGGKRHQRGKRDQGGDEQELLQPALHDPLPRQAEDGEGREISQLREAVDPRHVVEGRRRLIHSGRALRCCPHERRIRRERRRRRGGIPQQHRSVRPISFADASLSPTTRAKNSVMASRSTAATSTPLKVSPGRRLATSSASCCASRTRSTNTSSGSAEASLRAWK